MRALTADMANDAKVTEAPRHNSATGYGPKIPTQYMLRIGTRWHRVYVANYGNSGSLYVLISEQRHYLSGSAELVLETLRDGGSFEDAKAKLGGWPDWMKEAEASEAADRNAGGAAE